MIVRDWTHCIFIRPQQLVWLYNVMVLSLDFLFPCSNLSNSSLKRWKISVIIKIDFLSNFCTQPTALDCSLTHLRALDGTLTQPTHTVLNGTLSLRCGIPKVNEGRNFIHDGVFANSCLYVVPWLVDLSKYILLLKYIWLLGCINTNINKLS